MASKKIFKSDPKYNEEILNPLALRSSGPGSEQDTARAFLFGTTAKFGSDRSHFEHDRDRILHSRQFRKLAQKTQLLVNPVSGYFRTRITHTMEVYQLATSIARRLHLNVPAVEAMASGHDVGHTPFGHAGEEELNSLLSCIGGFHHACQGVRTLDSAAYNLHLYKDENTLGLNLTFAVREGILKHGWFEDAMKTPYHIEHVLPHVWNLAGNNEREYGSLEAQIVELTDRIAYLNHDLDDLYSASFTKIYDEKLLRDFLKRQRANYPDKSPGVWDQIVLQFLRLLGGDEASRTKELVRDATDESLKKINRCSKEKLDLKKEKMICFSPRMEIARNLFYPFFSDFVYSDSRFQKHHTESKETVRKLFRILEETFNSDNSLWPAHIQLEFSHDPPWWSEYLKKFYEGQKNVTIPGNSEIASKLAAADVLADFTDLEANRFEELAGKKSADILPHGMIHSFFPQADALHELVRAREELRDRVNKIKF